MDLCQYDNQWVRIIDKRGDKFEGLCTYNHAEYNEHEFGRAEDCLQMIYFLFYESDILSVESIGDHHGIYGRFDDPYGTFEIMTVEDGFDSILEVLECEEKDHIMRLLNCLDRYMDPGFGYEFSCKYETIGALQELIDSTDDEDIRQEAERLIEIGMAGSGVVG